MTKNKNKKSSEAAKQEAFKLSDGICYCKTPAVLDRGTQDRFPDDRKYGNPGVTGAGSTSGCRRNRCNPVEEEQDMEREKKSF